MKILSTVFALLTVGAIRSLADPTANPGQTGLPAPTAYAITQQDGNSRVWERTEYEQSPSGQVIARKHSYTELATGLNHLVNGKWIESTEKISILPDGTAAATNGQHQAYFPGDIYTGAIKLVTPDGKVLQSQPVALSYDDGSNTVLIAVITNSVGQLVDANQLVYPNAFAGLQADLHYTYRKSGFEQDVVLHEQPPAPADLGLNPATTRLQVLTEFFNPPQPKVTTRKSNAKQKQAEDDEELTFGSMVMVPGKAFSLGNEILQPSDRMRGTHVRKSWTKIQNRQLLVEEVPTAVIGDGLKSLPALNSQTQLSRQSPSLAEELILPASHIVHNQPNTKSIRLAKADSLKSGLVLDYDMVNGSVTNFTFQGDTTYFINNFVTVYGTAIFEGGTVIKFDVPGFVRIYGAVICSTAPYRPACFTSKNDNSIGEIISGSTGRPGNTSAGISVSGTSSPLMIKNFRMSYLSGGIGFDGVNGTIYDSQFVNDQTGLSLTASTINIRNVLFASVTTPFASGGGVTINVQNASFYNVAYLNAGAGANVIILTNCILAEVGGLTPNAGLASFIASNIGFYNDNFLPFGSVPTTTTINPFKTVGGGSYYLATNSAFRGAGIKYIDSSLLADLATKTTYPPIVYSNAMLTGQLTFSPQAKHDSNTSTPDLGYHYDPIDYIFSNCQANANLTFNPGTSVGWQGQGLSFTGYGQIAFNGATLNPCYFVRCNTAQEQDRSGDGIGITDSNGTDWPYISASFTRFSALGTNATFFNANSAYVDACNSEFWCGNVGGDITGGIQATFYNCLFDRSSVNLVAANNSPYGFLLLQNCTFHGGSLTVNNLNDNTQVQIYDTAFDGTAITTSDPYNGQTFNASYNAYVSGANQFPNDVDDTYVSNYGWENGLLGDFYLPANSLLINAGNYPANQIQNCSGSLYSFTTQTNQTPEEDTVVDIGYHYATLVANDISQQMCPNSPGSAQSWDFCMDSYNNGWDSQNDDGFGLPVIYSILTQPAHGTLVKGSNCGSSEFTYTPNQCYEGSDTFTYQISDGLFVSAPATVTISISDTVTADPPSVQTCRGTISQQFTLSGNDNCGQQQFTYAIISSPANGYLTGTPGTATDPIYTYTPSNSSYTGTDSFSYRITSECGDSAIGTVTVIVGDANLSPNGQAPMTGTNQTLSVTLTTQDNDSCRDTGLNYTLQGPPSHGGVTINSGTGVAQYTPALNFEGEDSFTFNVSDGTWSSAPNYGTVNVFVVAGPTNLVAQCQFNQIVLNWGLDSAVQQMQQSGLSIQDFRVYRATVHGGPYSLIYTTDNSSQTTCVDQNVSSGVTYYYVVTFQYQDYSTSPPYIYESPLSREVAFNPCSLPTPILPGFNQNTLPANDDGSTALINLAFPLNFFSTVYSNLYVNNNGNITFDEPLGEYTPLPLANLGMDIIAPFWADVDTRGAGSALVTYGTGTVDGHPAFGANWVNVGYFTYHYDKLNSFQLILIDRSDIAAGDFDLEFNYVRIQWETGDASGGSDGFGGSPARVGFASSDGPTFELNGSGVTGAFLDSNPTTGLIYNSLNDDVPGQYLFSFRNGTVAILPPVVINPSGSATVPVTVTLSVPGQPTASIYYTLDGSTPTTASILYSGPINLATSAVLKAIAAEPGWNNSEISSASFGPAPVPVITSQPTSQTTIVGGNATFSVTANGLDPLQYQWIFNGSVVGNEPSLVLQDVDDSDAGNYYVIVSDVNGNAVQSSTVTLTVNDDSPSIPTIDIVSPVNNADVSGTITVQADGYDAVGTVRANLFADGNLVASQKYDSPYDLVFDTTALSNGSHQLVAKTYNLDNYEGVSSTININVNNLIYNCQMSGDAFIPGGDDVSADTATISANFTTSVNWTLTITSSSGTTVASFSGSGTQITQAWDGTGSTGPDNYTWTLTATPTQSPSQAISPSQLRASQNASMPTQTLYRRMNLFSPAPDWDNVNFVNYHAYGADLNALSFRAIAELYLFTYVGLGAYAFPLPSDVYTYENRIWETLLGYDGDEVPNFLKDDLVNNLSSDNVVYLLCHGYGAKNDPESQLFDSNNNPDGQGNNVIERTDLEGALRGNSRGIMFAQINACNGGTYEDEYGNNDLALGFGVSNYPMTYRRACLAWSARFDGTLPYPLCYRDGDVLYAPPELYTFDQVLWNDLYSNEMTILDATADAYSSSAEPFAIPIIYGDPTLVLPQPLY